MKDEKIEVLLSNLRFDEVFHVSFTSIEMFCCYFSQYVNNSSVIQKKIIPVRLIYLSFRISWQSILIQKVVLVDNGLRLKVTYLCYTYTLLVFLTVVQTCFPFRQNRESISLHIFAWV